MKPINLSYTRLSFKCPPNCIKLKIYGLSTTSDASYLYSFSTFSDNTLLSQSNILQRNADEVACINHIKANGYICIMLNQKRNATLLNY